jgi:hypothetical protein
MRFEPRNVKPWETGQSRQTAVCFEKIFLGVKFDSDLKPSTGCFSVVVPVARKCVERLACSALRKTERPNAMKRFAITRRTTTIEMILV